MAIVRDLSGNSPASDVENPAGGPGPVTGTLSSSGQSSTFNPVPGRPFAVSWTGSSFTGAVAIERRAKGGTTWINVASDSTGTNNSYSNDEVLALTEPTDGASYRLNVTVTTGTLTYRFAQ